MNAPALGRDVAPLGRSLGATGFAREAPLNRYSSNNHISNTKYILIIMAYSKN
jgi:hypothetical protein